MKRILVFGLVVSIIMTMLSLTVVAKVSNEDIFNNKFINILDIKSSSGDYTDSIIEGLENLEMAGGGTLYFPQGSYLIKPMKIEIPSNIKITGDLDSQGKPLAILYTEENSLYNFVLRTRYKSNNILIENLRFNQMKDIDQVPQSQNLLGCSIIAILDTDNAKVENCEFDIYGTCAVISQSHYETQMTNITLNNNIAYFERRGNTFYDVSVFSVDGRNVWVTNNKVNGVYIAGSRHYKPRTGFEIHSPNCYVSGNTTTNVEQGILHVNWPSLWHTFENDFQGVIDINNNTINKCIIGIYLWSGNMGFDAPTKNVKVSDNNINMFVDEYYKPAMAIAVKTGDGLSSSISHVELIRNKIEVTKADYISSIETAMHLLITGSNTGAFLINLDNNVNNLVIKENEVKNFPYSFLNLYRRNGNSGTLAHTDIDVYDNIITDTAYVHSYGGEYDAIYNIGNVNGINIYQNQIIKVNEQSIDTIHKIENVVGLDYKEYVKPVDDPVADPERVYSGVLGVWANSKQIYTYGIEQCKAGDRIKTVNNEEVIVDKVSGNYIFLKEAVNSWSGAKALVLVLDEQIEPSRKYSGVLGVWANSKQIYTYGIEQCRVGDIIQTINNEESKVIKVGINYLYLETGISSWAGASSLSLKGEGDELPPVEPDKVYDGVIGVWANSKQIYVYNIDQCDSGDKFITPNDEIGIIDVVSGNYIYLLNEVSQWSYGKLVYTK